MTNGDPMPPTRRAPFCWIYRYFNAICVEITVFLIRFYQFAIRPFLAGSCKFVPRCSEYGIEALYRHGWPRGLVLTVRRIVRCHPFGRGGIDPVPDSIAPSGNA